MSDSKLSVHINSIVVSATGIEDWSTLTELATGERRYQVTDNKIAQPNLLEPRERRRASPTVSLSLAMAEQAQQQSGIPAAECRKVFSTSSGDVDIYDYICNELSMPEPAISPTKFHHSLHNSAAGYYDIATHSQQASCSISAENYGFAAGLLDVALQCQIEQTPVLYVTYELPSPKAMQKPNPIFNFFCVGMVLTPQKTSHSIARCDIALHNPAKPITTLPDPELETLRQSNPAAYSLPLLIALAKQQNTHLQFATVPPASLEVCLTCENNS